ncbi:Na+/H+ antiporter subunit E [Phormidium pseudopriestleyi FRX01]|uniref:Na+/H+ antiporter subunit E n=1 Tax=Phormidium pseudopriestleyi FRX01 TaxID=1759528 RepID=A0ABS3FQR0_9CYAN|nr:Na+/H+ antiporter subunit E [Phormidium pseudopriestleyi]MBO0349456.1 Na+/H+ antiporter subunit E [Phormidium pseudopriestleyi FRX01]
MIGYLNLILRLIIWFLLTADLSSQNILIGVIISLLLPHNHKIKGHIQDWMRALWEIIVAVPIAYMEAFEIILFPHRFEDVTRERVPPLRSPGLVFLDIFLITFTPKTIVVKYHEEGWYEVHRLRRRSPE